VRDLKVLEEISAPSSPDGPHLAEVSRADFARLVEAGLVTCKAWNAGPRTERYGLTEKGIAVLAKAKAAKEAGPLFEFTRIVATSSARRALK
jgi:hypothetical protein